MGSKSLVSAARYIDAVFDIQINENDPNLDQIIHKVMETLNSPEIEKYWYEYQLEIDPDFGDKIKEQLSLKQITVKNKDVRFYRGVPIEENNKSTAESSETENIQILEKRRARILPFFK